MGAPVESVIFDGARLLFNSKVTLMASSCATNCTWARARNRSPYGTYARTIPLAGISRDRPFPGGGRFLLICPQGPVETAIGPGAVGYGWFPLKLNGPADLGAILSAKERLDVFLDDSLKRYPIDREKLILLGFSQGGAMTYSLALAEPQRFAAAAVLSSWLSQELVDALKIEAGAEFPPILVQHGSRDDLIVVDRARDSVERLRGLRVPVTYREYDMGHEISPRSLADLSAWIEEKVKRRR